MSQKILFVCLGNICRSPLAEGIMLDLNARHALNWTIDSAGTASYHVGEAPDHRTIMNARKNGIDLSSLRARQFVPQDLDQFDHVFVMDKNNQRNVLSLAVNDAQRNKVRLFLDYATEGKYSEVPDPYYGEEEGFELVFRLVKKACENLLLKLNPTHATATSEQNA